MPHVHELPSVSPQTVADLRNVTGIVLLEQTVQQVQTDLGEAQDLAQAASTAASTATTTANTAKTTADTAKTTADTAAGNASTALQAANVAVAAAAEASTAVEEAQDQIDTAVADAATAKTLATSANTAASAADTKATNAGTAASNAQTTATAAQTAAGNAQTAANTAQAKADAADTKANNLRTDLDSLTDTVQAIQDQIGGVNQVPVATPITIDVDEDTVNYQGSVFDHVVDPDGDDMVVVESTYNSTKFNAGTQFNTVYGTMLVAVNGNYTFTPNATAQALNDGETGTVAFAILVRDARGGTATWNLTIRVIGSTDEAGGGDDDNTTFDALYDPSFKLIENQNFYSRPTMSKPSKMTSYTQPSYTDPVFGTKIFGLTRVNDTSDNITNLRHVYSRQTAINADNTRSIVRAGNGWWHLYNLQTGQRILGGRTQTPGFGALVDFINECECVWHPTNPKKLWRTGNQGAGCIWYEYDIDTMTTTVLFDLNPLLQALGGAWANAGRAWFKGEGRPSNDGRWWGFQVETASYGMIGLIMYDRQTNTIVGSALTTNRPDHVSTSPLGNYIVPSWYGGTTETLASSATRPMNEANGARAYSRDFSSFTQLSSLGEHSDLAIDAQGNEVFVSVSYRGGTSGQEPDVADGGIYYRRMDNGVAYSLPGNAYQDSSDGGVHLSGLATKKPGWAVVSWYGGTPKTWKDGVVYAVELTPDNPKTLRICHHQTVAQGAEAYIAESHAVPSPDMSMILFASNYGGSVVEDYYVGLPSWAFGVAGAGRPPVNQTLPAVSGQVTPNAVLTCTAGMWSGVGITYSYQWYRDSGTIISGQTTNSFTIPSGAAAGTQYYCRVTATNATDTVYAESNKITVQVPSAPVNTAKPTITGGSAVGSLLTAQPGTWSGLPTPDFTYAWYRNGTALGVTTRTYTANDLGDYTVQVRAENTQGFATEMSTVKTIVAAADPKAAVGSPVNTTNTWQSSGSIAVPSVAVGDSILLVVSLDEGSGDGNLNSITATVLGKPLNLLYSTPLITLSSGRMVRQHYYVADKVTAAGTATINVTFEANTHYAMQAQRFTGGIATVDVTAPGGFNATAFATPHPTGTVSATIANSVEVISLVGATDMSNAALTLPSGFTSMGADNVGPLVAITGYRVRTTIGNIGGTITSMNGGYGSGWAASALNLY
ncbi:hypothetical protein LUCX_246 [Xanthomonas phage vB_XciM_LucasX]|nr:hypothetical protein LUCX_246 [Xanthomonas phage vB_XciM_LucasX]